MPSPFPGMDPYLEIPWMWPDVHHGLISACQELLNQQLRPRYFASVEERVYVADDIDPDRTLYVPDIRIAGRNGDGAKKPRGARANSAREADPPYIVTTVVPEQADEGRPRL